MFQNDQEKTMCCFFPQPSHTTTPVTRHTQTHTHKKMAVYDHWFDDLVLYTAMGGLLIAFCRAKKFFVKWALLVLLIYFLFNWVPYIAGRAIQFFVQEAVHRGWLSPETLINVTRWYGDSLYDRLSGSKTFTSVTTLVGDHHNHNTQPADAAAAAAAASEPPPPLPPPAAPGGWRSLFG